MLGKLLKYEYKATARTFLPLYGVLLLAALLSAFSLKAEIPFLSGISVFVLFGLFVGVWGVTLVLCIQRFNDGLLKREGYLMFTLPVKTSSLIWSKLIAATTWFVGSCLVSLISGLFFGTIMSEVPIEWQEIMQAFSSYLQTAGSGATWLLIQMILIFILATVCFLLTVYTSLTIGQLPFAGRHRFLTAFGAFIVLSIITQQLSIGMGHIFNINNAQMMQSFDSYGPLTDPATATAMLNYILGFGNIFTLVISAALLFLTNYLLKRKLNLE